MKKINQKGFTMAELLIVVAIIAVLVAIAIPVFTTQLEKAREGTDLANIRSAYAECTTSVLGNTAGYCKKVTVQQKTDGWTSSPDKVAGTLDVKTDTVGSKLGETNTTVYVCVDADGNLSLSTTAVGTEIN